jgi:hypothetical protein
VLESIYAEDNVVQRHAKLSEKHPGQVDCVFRFTPNTGFDQAKVAVIVIAKFEFTQKVSILIRFIKLIIVSI